MKKTSLVVFLLLLFIGCHQQENEFYSSDETTPVSSYLLTRNMTNFFDTDGTDEHLQNIVTYLQLCDDASSFTPSFIEHYGYPLWREAYPLTLDDYSVYIVPILKNSEINTIWIFEMDRFHTRYYILPRLVEDDPNSSFSWMFDYFNVEFSLRNTNDKGETIIFTKAAQTRATIEVRYCNEIWTGYINSKGEEVIEYQYTHCWTEYLHVFSIPPGSGDGNGGNETPPTGGGGGGGSLPVGNSSFLSAFTSVTSLSEDDKEKLEDAVKDMLNDCYAEAIYSYLKTRNVKFGKVSINPNISGETQFGFDSHDITFRDSEFIDGGAIYHEMFHLFQKFINPSAATNEMRGMMEYERTLFEDIAFSMQNTNRRKKEIPHSVYIKRKSPWMYNMKTPDDEVKKYKNWIKKITVKFTAYPTTISNEVFSNWVDIFAASTNSMYEGYNYSVSYSPVTINKAFELAKNNCNK